MMMYLNFSQKVLFVIFNIMKMVMCNSINWQQNGLWINNFSQFLNLLVIRKQKKKYREICDKSESYNRNYLKVFLDLNFHYTYNRISYIKYMNVFLCSMVFLRPKTKIILFKKETFKIINKNIVKLSAIKNKHKTTIMTSFSPIFL